MAYFFMKRTRNSGVDKMYISARERKILDFLLDKSDETTVKQLAEELDVSARTVHRDLKGVEEILKEYRLRLMKKSGSGIQVAGDEEGKEKLKLFLFTLSHNEYTPEERQNMILSELLDEKEPVKLISLANDLNVTIATISNDLNKVEERIAPFDLTLIRKRGYGVEITGTESAKRKAMSRLIIENIDEFEFISILKENIQKKSTQYMDTITDRLLGLVDKKKLLTIEKQIEKIKPELPYSIADSAYIGLVVHLALAIERIQQGEEINFDLDDLNQLKETREYKVAEKIVSGLEDAFRIEISHGEVGYITMHLMGAKLRNENDDMFEEPSLHIGLFAQKLIRYVSDEVGQDLTRNVSLYQGLVAHLRPAMYRIKQNMGISNPLLSKIETDYRELFDTIQNVVKEMTPDLYVPKEEIGYLVMHFASALLKTDIVKTYHILVVCSSGIGTSKMLSTKLEQEIAGIKTVNASLFDLETVRLKDFDAIISTIPLKIENDYLVVNPLLLPDDVEKVKRFLFEKKEFALEESSRAGKTNEHMYRANFLEEMTKVKNYANAIYHILNELHISTTREEATKEVILKDLCETLQKKNVITSVGAVLHDLHKREETGGLGIPETAIALYHTRSDHIRLPSVSVNKLSHPIPVKAMDDSVIHIKTMILMLAPKDEANEETLEVLSGISSFIIRDEQTITQFESSEEEEIKRLLENELQMKYEEKVLKKESKS